MIARAISILIIVLGLAVLGRTVIEGVGGGVGLLLGTLLVAAGALRLYIGGVR